jgi:hypothetical protein
VQSRVRILRLEAKQITAVKVIRKANHVGLKALAGGKPLTLTARHRSECLRAILSHRLSRGSKFLDDIEVRAPLVFFVASPRDIQLLRNIWRKRQRVNQGVSNSDQPPGIVNSPEVAAMIARLADQQQYALASCRPLGEHFRRMGYGVENGRSVIPWLEILQIRFDDIRLICKILDQIQFAVEEQQGAASF